ncbi:hypothetical protein FB451DRAFT_1495668 [Mycena latifolia]|nr:hypothetical protein FB451DRAFT_1495668 [Mycena latifolia]
MSLWPFLRPREHGSPSSSPVSAGGTSCTVLIDRSRGPTESGIPIPTLLAAPRGGFSPEPNVVAGSPRTPGSSGTAKEKRERSATAAPVSFRATPSFQGSERTSAASTSAARFESNGADVDLQENSIASLIPSPSHNNPKTRNLAPQTSKGRKSSHGKIPISKPRYISNTGSRAKPAIPRTRSSARLLQKSQSTSTTGGPAIPSPFDTRLTCKLRAATHWTVWYHSNEPAFVEPPNPRADQTVQAGELFLNTWDDKTMAWIRANNNQSWQSIREGHSQNFGKGYRPGIAITSWPSTSSMEGPVFSSSRSSDSISRADFTSASQEKAAATKAADAAKCEQAIMMISALAETVIYHSKRFATEPFPSILLYPGIHAATEQDDADEAEPKVPVFLGICGAGLETCEQEEEQASVPRKTADTRPDTTLAGGNKGDPEGQLIEEEDPPAARVEESAGTEASASVSVNGSDDDIDEPSDRDNRVQFSEARKIHLKRCWEDMMGVLDNPHRVQPKMAAVLEGAFGKIERIGGDTGKDKRRTNPRTWDDNNSNIIRHVLWILEGVCLPRSRRISPGQRTEANSTILEFGDRYPDPISSLEFSPDGTRITGAQGGHFTVWDIHHKKLLHTEHGESEDSVVSQNWSSDGLNTVFASGWVVTVRLDTKKAVAQGGKVSIWSRALGQERWIFQENLTVPVDLQKSPPVAKSIYWDQAQVGFGGRKTAVVFQDTRAFRIYDHPACTLADNFPTSDSPGPMTFVRRGKMFIGAVGDRLLLWELDAPDKEKHPIILSHEGATGIPITGVAQNSTPYRWLHEPRHSIAVAQGSTVTIWRNAEEPEIYVMASLKSGVMLGIVLFLFFIFFGGMGN